MFCTAATHGEHSGLAGLLLFKYALYRVQYTSAAFGHFFSAALQMLIVLDNRFPSEDFACIIFRALQLILRRHRVDRRLVPGLMRMVQKRAQAAPATELDCTGCCIVLRAVVRACSVEQLPLVADGLVQYALVHLDLRVGSVPGDVLWVFVCMFNRALRSTAWARVACTKSLPALFGALAQLASTYRLLSPASRAKDRYLLVDALTALLRTSFEYPREHLLHVQGLCVGMLALRPCLVQLAKVKRLLLYICASNKHINEFVLKETLVARLLRIDSQDARIRREVLEMLSYIIDCNQRQCLCTNFAEGVCQQVLLYCINTAPVPEGSAMCSYCNAGIVSTIIQSAAQGQHKRGAHSAARAQTLEFLAQLPRAVRGDLGLQQHLVQLL